MLEVEEENQAQIIGKNGQNLRLMTHMIGWSFKVFNREQFKEYQEASLEEKYEKMGVRLSLNESEVQSLKVKEFDQLEKIIDANQPDLVEIFKTESRAQEVTNLANELLLQDAFNQDFNDPTMEDSLVSLKGITNEILSELSNKSIKKLEDLAEMSVPELMDISDSITESEASALIMEARKPWFCLLYTSPSPRDS